jgi:hypothetical protein
MGPSTAPKEGCNGLGQVRIPSSLQGDDGLNASPLLLPKASDFAAQIWFAVALEFGECLGAMQK